MDESLGYWIVAISIALYTLFYAISFVPQIHGRLFGPALRDPYLRGQVLIGRLNGLLVLGAFSSFILIAFFREYPIEQFGIAWGSSRAIWYILACSAIIIPMNYFNSKTDANLAIYPMIRFPVWTAPRVTISLVSWTMYLAGYEFFFRGFLFFGCYYAFGLWQSVVINLVIYGIAHYLKNVKEAIGSIPLGIVLCYISYDTGSVLPALIIHIVLAWSNELFSILHHPYMKFASRLS